MEGRTWDTAGNTYIIVSRFTSPECFRVDAYPVWCKTRESQLGGLVVDERIARNAPSFCLSERPHGTAPSVWEMRQPLGAKPASCG